MTEPSSDQTRPSLLFRVRNPRDRQAWEEFATIYGPLVYRHARRRGLAHQDAEDVTQKVFLKISEAIRSFEYQKERGRFRDWLGMIVRNEVVRHWQREEKHAAAQGGDSQVLDGIAGASVDPEWIADYQECLLQTALARCQPHFELPTWRAFQSVWLERRLPVEVASELGQPIDWVYVAKSRVLKRLWQEVQELADDAPFLLGSVEASGDAQ